MVGQQANRPASYLIKHPYLCFSLLSISSSISRENRAHLPATLVKTPDTAFLLLAILHQHPRLNPHSLPSLDRVNIPLVHHEIDYQGRR
jgi:hypothetical protein